jgi:hypothetical protein
MRKGVKGVKDIIDNYICTDKYMEWLYCCFRRAQEIVEKVEKEIQEKYPNSFDMERNVNPMHHPNSPLTDIIIG